MSIQRVMMTADTVGGVWTYAIELARGLAARQVRVLLVTLGEPPHAGQRAQAAAVPGLEMRHGAFPLEWMDGALESQPAAGQWLLKLATQWQPDVVHLNHYGHGHLPWPAPAVVVAHSCVCSWHEHVRGAPAGSEWNAYRALVGRGLRAAPLVIAPTAAMLADVARLYGPLRDGRVIHNGRRPDEFEPAPKEDAVLCAGRLWDEAKNVRTLATVAGDLPWPVRVAGEIWHPQGGRVHLRHIVPLGRLTPKAMAQAYAKAAIYTLPARYEPFGLTVLEAALSGCALVLGDIPSLRELWRGAAVFVPPNDPARLHAALAQLMREPLLRKAWAKRAAKRAQRYSAQRMVDHYLDVYATSTREEVHACVS
ncbi:MAG TPA: glycosyltransferase family 4 protein [Rhodanobacteraceae bacterium]|nr:glycosyltransferase family 4 protein [Rhodanobacteraceae bacterium]